MAYGTINAEQLTTQSGFTLGAGNASSFKNRIFNPQMQIDQRNAGAAYTAGSGYTLDRWNVDRTWTGSTVTIQQSTTAPAGFTNSLVATVTTGAAVAAGSYFSIQQFMEGYNTADFALGTASAQQFTVSFWVRSSVTGTFGVGFRNSAFDLSYWTTYTVNAANTWEQKSVTIAAPTSGTFGTGNSYGLNTIFSLGCGSTNKATSNNSWNAGSKLGAIGETDLIATTGATFYITGVQLEVGTVATSFDYRSYGTELALCQRYFYSFKTVGISTPCLPWSGTTTNRCFANFTHPTTMRATPSVTTTGQFYNSIATTAPSGSATSVSAANITFNGNDTLRLGMDNNESGGTLWGVYVTGTASAEL
jgi:hypothetical protein